MTGRATNTPETPTILIALAAQVAGVAVAQIGEGCLFGHFLDLGKVDFGDFLQLAGILAGELGRQFLHVRLEGFGAEAWRGPVRIVKVVVGVNVIVIFRADPPTPGNRLHLASVGVHQRTRNAVRVVGVALATGVLVDLQGPRCRRKGGELVAVRCTAVGDLLVCGFRRRTGVADDAAVGVTQRFPLRQNLAHHAGRKRAGRLDSLVAGKTELPLCRKRSRRLAFRRRRRGRGMETAAQEKTAHAGQNGDEWACTRVI